MKKIANVVLKTFLWVVLIVIAILSLALLVIEARLLLSLDWSIYDNAFNGFIRYLCRLILSFGALILTILEMVNLFKKNQCLEEYLIVADMAFAISSLFVFVFAANYIDIVCISLAFSLLTIKATLKLLNK